VVTATAFRPAQIVAAKIEFDISGCGMISTAQAEIAKLLILILKCSITVTAVAVAD